MPALESDDRSARRRQQTVRVIAGYRETEHRKLLRALYSLALGCFAQVEHRAKERWLRLGAAEIHRVAEIDGRPRQPAPHYGRHASDRCRSQVRVVLRDALSVERDRRNRSQSKKHWLAQRRAHVVVEPVAEIIALCGGAESGRAFERLADSDLGHSAVEIESPSAAQEIVVGEFTRYSEAVEGPVTRADPRRVHRRLGEAHVKRHHGVGCAVRSDRYVLVRLRLIERALRVDDLGFAEKLARVEPHDAAHDSGRYLLLFAVHRRHFDLDCSNPRSRSGRNVQRVPCTQRAVAHSETIGRIGPWISIVVQALAHGVGRGVDREAIESAALANGKTPDERDSFRNRIQSAHHEGPQYHRRPLADVEPDLDRPGSQQLYHGVDGHSWIPPTAIKDYQPRPIVRELIPVQAMFDSEREVEVTPRPRRGSGDDRFGELGVREGVVALEHEPHHFQVAPLTLDVLSARAPANQERSGERERDDVPPPESYPGKLHSCSARAPGGCPGGSSRA